MCITLLQCLEYPGYEFLMSNKLNKAEFSSAIGPNSPGMWSEFSKAIRPNLLLVRVLQNPAVPLHYRDHELLGLNETLGGIVNSSFMVMAHIK